MPEPGISDRLSLTAAHCFWQAMDWIYPPSCIGCGKEGDRWCVDCQSMIERVGQRVCPRCGKRIKGQAICPECTERKPAYTALRSFGLYRDPLQKAILRLKYHRDLGLGEILAGFLAQLIAEQDWKLDVVIPVPLSRAKMTERGYNQVDLFARPLAWRLGMPYNSRILTRVQEDMSQVRLSAQGRRLNVAHSFRVDNGCQVKGKCLLLVDDVATTGSTAEACTRALIAGGAEKVYVATLARSLLRKPLPSKI